MANNQDLSAHTQYNSIIFELLSYLWSFFMFFPSRPSPPINALHSSFDRWTRKKNGQILVRRTNHRMSPPSQQNWHTNLRQECLCWKRTEGRKCNFRTCCLSIIWCHCFTRTRTTILPAILVTIIMHPPHTHSPYGHSYMYLDAFKAHEYTKHENDLCTSLIIAYSSMHHNVGMGQVQNGHL